MPDAIAATGATPAAPPTTSAGSSLGTLGKDAFLKLLVAQLKYQNPLSPQDPSEMMGQTAQFTMVEKLEELASAASSQVTAQRAVLATSMLGRTITAKAPDGTTTTGLVTTVDVSSGEPTVTVGGRAIGLTAVQTVASA